jgi:hypothetical protein
MEILKNYLESMFMNLPNTAEVRRAKDELWQMMEDKYAELTAEGKSENEVIGTIISEFGNLDEIADELGIESVVRPQEYADFAQEERQAGTDAASAGIPPIQRRLVAMEEAKAYLKDCETSAFCIAFGVMLCILSMVPPILTDTIRVKDAYGAAGMFLVIAVAVGFFVANGIRMQKWHYLQKEPCSVDFATSNMVNERKIQYRGVYAILLTVGIVLCVVSVVPEILLDELGTFSGIVDTDGLGAIALFVLVAIGVFMIVLGCCTQGGFHRLLALNDSGTMAGNYASKQKTKKWPRVVAVLAIVTVACMFLGLVSCVLGGSIVKYRFGKNVSAEQADWETTLDAFSTVQMNLAAAEVIIERGSDYTIAYTGDADLETDYSVDGDVLKITNGKNYKNIHSVSECTLTVTLPEDASLAELNVVMNAGELQICGIDAGNLDVEMNAGNVEVSNGNFTYVSADVDAGNMTFDSCTVTSTSADTNMGNIEFRNCTFDVIDAAADMGNIEINSSRSLDGYEIRMSADLGGITVNGQSYSGSYHADGDSAHYVDLSVDLGNVELTY